MLVETAEDRRWRSGDDPSSVLVFIGKGLDEKALREAFETCLC
jgi:G3E family GTPase